MFMQNQFVGPDICLEDAKAQLGLVDVTFEMSTIMGGKKLFCLKNC